MFVVARKILDRIAITGGELISVENRDHRQTIAVLLYRMVVVDGRIRQSEVAMFRTMLSEHLQISDDELELFERAVQKCITNEEPMFGESGIFGAMPMEKRRELLVMMQDLSLSDSELHEFEINLLVRISELMGIGDMQ